MKNIVLRLFTYIAILYLIDSLIVGFEINSALTVCMFALLMSICDVAIRPVIKFLTIPLNFMTFGLFNFLLSCLFMYFFDVIIAGFQITNGYIGPIKNELLQSPLISVTKIGIIVFSSFIISLLNNIVSWTQD